jgi:hypothetical protein
LHSYPVWNKISCSLVVHDHCFPTLWQGSKTQVHKAVFTTERANWSSWNLSGYWRTVTRSRDSPQFRCPSAISSAVAPFTIFF